MTKRNLIIDIALCHNCNNCVISTKDEYTGNAFPPYAAPQPAHGHDWLRIRRRNRGTAPMVDVAYLPVMCNHCDNAPCMNAARDGSIYKRADGIVIFDPVKTKGRKELVKSCPYGAITWNEELQVPQAWPFDAHLLDSGWKEPRCAQSCPTGAIRAVTAGDREMEEIARAENLQVLLPKLGTRPRVYYKNLHRYAQHFIGGTVITDTAGVEDLAEGIPVRLTRNGNVLAECVTDAFGDFKFDGLEGDGAKYDVVIASHATGTRSIPVELHQSTYIGKIRATP